MYSYQICRGSGCFDDDNDDDDDDVDDAVRIQRELVSANVKSLPKGKDLSRIASVPVHLYFLCCLHTANHVMVNPLFTLSDHVRRLKNVKL